MEPILTPEQILALSDKGQAYKEIHRYAHEVAETAAIITHHLFDEIMEQCRAGAMHTIGLISVHAEQFVAAHGHVIEWDTWIGAQAAITATDWEDYVIAWTRHQIQQLTK